MINKCTVFVALICIALVSSATVRRDAPAQPEKDVSIQNVLNDLNAVFLKTFGFQNNEQAEAELKENGQKIVGALDAFVGKLKTETEHLKDSEIVKGIRESALAVEEDLKKKHPQSAADLENVGKSLNELTKKVLSIGQTKEAEQLRALGDNLLVEIRKGFTNALDEVTKNVKTTK